MGYDMEWAQVPPEMVAAAEKAREVAYAVDRRCREANDQLRADGIHPYNSYRDDEADADPRAVAIERERRAAWDAYDAAKPYYFRLNIWGMQIARQVMAEAGMAVEVGVLPPFPQPEAYGTTHDQVEDECYDAANGYAEREPVTPAVRAYVDATEAHLADSHGAAVIPLHKLGSNDGWWITPAEIAAALKVAPEIAKHEDGTEITWWIRWLDYLRRAAQHGGVRVH